METVAYDVVTQDHTKPFSTRNENVIKNLRACEEKLISRRFTIIGFSIILYLNVKYVFEI